MTDKDLIEACDILLKLEQEFSVEESRLSEISNEHAMRIDELDQQITVSRRNEDVDFRVFSPRNVSGGTSDKIKVLEDEKKSLEREKKDADKQLRYYSGKTEMIGRVLAILRGNLKEGSEDDSQTVVRSRDPFAFIDEEEEKTVDPVSQKADSVASLFREANAKIKEDLIGSMDDEPVTDVYEKTSSGSVKTTATISSEGGVPVDEVERVCHKVEFCGKIMSNDGIRAKLEIKNIVADLKDLIRAYR